MSKGLKKWKLEDLAEAVANAKCYVDVLRNLGLGVAGGNQGTIKKHIKRLNINTDHFDPYAIRLKSLRALHLRKRYTEKEALIEGWTGSQNVIKRLMRASFTMACAECGIGPIWNNKKLVLQLDHINGIKIDCRKENLRWLCPNCHTQTSTFTGRNSWVSGTLDTRKKCIDCSANIMQKSERCVPCRRKFQRKQKFVVENKCVECDENANTIELCAPCKIKFKRAAYKRKTKIQWPSVEQVHKDVLLLGYRGVGNNLGVSDAAVKKFLKKNGINIPRYHTQNNLELCWKK